MVGGHGTSSRFDFLGFTHFWGKSRKGHWFVRQITARVRLAQAVKSARNWCKQHRHMPSWDQSRHLAGAIRGHCACCGLTGNGKRLSGFRNAAVGSWRRWLGRHHRNERINWDRFNGILARFPLPSASVTRSICAP